MNPDSTRTDEPFVWCGIIDPDQVFDDVVAAGHELADAAKMGDWSTVFDLLDDPDELVDINWWRPGGTAWFTVLHQAAWQGAPNEVAAELIERGALRSLPDAWGRTAYDVRCERDLNAGRPKDVAAQQRKSLVLRTRYLKPPLRRWHRTIFARSTGTWPMSSTAASVACSMTDGTRNASCGTRRSRSCTSCRTSTCGFRCRA
ncbi:ankyrin repeat domain-containing protein [Mycobacterium intermedium]|nr:ankyrin repeat domain-containing protein [Mycobacterium intermedium]